jgi:hypothetical protein
VSLSIKEIGPGARPLQLSICTGVVQISIVAAVAFSMKKITPRARPLGLSIYTDLI